MKRKPKSPDPSEIDELRARLEEAEQTLDAIRSGKVDALVVSGPAGERVFTLQGADHRYRRIVEEMTEGAAIVSPEGIVLYANAAIAELVAVPLSRVLGSQVRRYVAAESASTIDRLLRDAGKGTVAAEAVLLSGGERPVSVHVSAAADTDQMDGGVCLIVTDLTGAMRAAEERFQFVSDMLPQIIWSARPDGWTDSFNRRWFELTGRTLAETEGWAWTRVLHPDDVERCTTAWKHSVETGAPFETTYRVRRASDGAYRWHLGRATAQRGDDGAILRWYGSATDIEDERALGAEAERARHRAEEATRLKDEFLATLSHELRTPLNAILGWGRMFQTGSIAEDKKQHAIDVIVRNARSQNQLIEDLLDVSRIMSGKLRLDVGPVAVSQVIEAALDVVRPAADAKGVRLQPVLDVEAGLITGDAGRLQQVIWNLLTNAVKFTPRGGRVHISLRRVGSSAEISVADTGAGIAREFLPYVFDRFRQEDGAITRRTGGLGLGLAIAKSIVELHGGTVEAHSDGEGTGCTFVVLLPVAAVRSSVSTQSVRPSPEAKPENVDVPYPPELAGLKVLVVDDEPDARDLLKLVLERCDAVVTTAASAASALEVIPALQPDVIVSDVGMPDEDGYSFIRKLRAFPRQEGGRTPAVALTAYARPEDRTRALMSGFQSHATKPIDPQELVVVVANLAGRYT